ncbi:efflux RND transporter periplasmic adaptor subunit [uncultured Bacteroides sp.]|uniref:efflux RND transporter periplasmic adaptor subunit n=1 Tax=uncultured Bacteroides sp. TaxID=162156 RepID=UPI002AA62116|nr:efflux RND transporter periplasmic adaptor subunit [uncultured Bacteroides sp.]
MRIYSYAYILMCAILLSSCKGQKDESGASGSVKVKAVKVTATTMEDGKSYVGTVEASTLSSLSFQVMGNVNKVLISEGEKIQKGQLLATLDPVTLQSTYDAALSTLKQAQDAYNRMKTLHESGSLPEIKWVEVESKLQQAQSMEQIARKDKKDAGLYAPFSGVIAAKNLEPGMNVMPGIEVMQLAEINRVNIKIAVPENEVSEIEKKQTAQITVAALGNKSFEGTVAEKGIIANPLSHTYEVKIELANARGELMPGMVCNVVLADKANKPVIILPNNAIQLKADGERFVWLAKNGVATLKTIQIGSLTKMGIVITEGLTEGDMVITEGSQKVSEGTKITVE